MKKVIVLKNTHPSKQIRYYLDNNLPIPNKLQSGYESSVRSQFRLAKYINDNPNKIYIYENNYDLRHGHYDYIDEQAEDLFPDGLPKKYSLLTLGQKNFLACYGGVMLCVGKNIIKQTYSDSQILLDKTQFYKKTGLSSAAEKNLARESWEDLNREYLAIDNAIKLGNELGEEQVYIIYGGAHLFIDLAVCFPGIDLSVENLESMTGTFLIEAKKQEQAEWNVRPAINCDLINQQFFAKPMLHNSRDSQLSSSFLDVSIVAGIIALLGLMCFGIFKLAKFCWKLPQREQQHKLKSM